MPDHKTLAIARWPLARDQSPSRPRERLFEPLCNGLRLRATGPRTELPSMRDGTCEACGFMQHAPTCRYAPKPARPAPSSEAACKPAAAEPAREGERAAREGWRRCAKIDCPVDGASCTCWLFEGARKFHVFVKAGPDLPGARHVVRTVSGDIRDEFPTLLEAQLHVEAKLAASQPKAPVATSRECHCGTAGTGACMLCGFPPAPKPERGAWRFEKGDVVRSLKTGREHVVEAVYLDGDIACTGLIPVYHHSRFDLVRRAGTPACPETVEAPRFAPGMRVRCVEANGNYGHKVGDEFTVSSVRSNGELVFGDRGFVAHRFEPIGERSHG